MKHSSRWKKLATIVAVGLGVAVLIIYVGRASLQISGKRQLEEANATLDASDPGWRLADLEQTRSSAAPPSGRNPSDAVLDLHSRMPPEWKEDRQKAAWELDPVRNHLPSPRQAAWLSRLGQETEAHRAEVRAALLRPEFLAAKNGYFPLRFTDNPLATLLPHADVVRSMLDYVAYDSRLAVLDGKPELGLQSVRAQLVLARSIGDEPILISQLIRMACARSATESALQTLAWGEPKEGLAELQAEFREEADVPYLLYGLRGERGMMDRVFEGLESGKFSLRELESFGLGKPKMLDAAAMHLYQGLLPGDRAMALNMYTEYIAAAKLPPHERQAALARIPIPPRPPESYRYIVTRLLLPAVDKFCAANLRTRADLLTASVALACERFRLTHGRWPDRLDEIPREILPEVPLDPFTGEPVQYLRLADGIAVYTVGDDDATALERRRIAGDPLAEIGRGWKLWDPPHRGLPPLPDPASVDRPKGAPAAPESPE
jgi:hypothetical protein